MIQKADSSGYYEILTRMESEGEIITPDRFIPLIAQFNLSHRFDMCKLWKNYCCGCAIILRRSGARFSVNLMPLTLMQKEVATEICALFERHWTRLQPSNRGHYRSPKSRLSNSGCSITHSATAGLWIPDCY